MKSTMITVALAVFLLAGAMMLSTSAVANSDYFLGEWKFEASKTVGSTQMSMEKIMIFSWDGTFHMSINETITEGANSTSDVRTHDGNWKVEGEVLFMRNFGDSADWNVDDHGIPYQFSSDQTRLTVFPGVEGDELTYTKSGTADDRGENTICSLAILTIGLPVVALAGFVGIFGRKL